jgi:hypothetical protein
MVFPRGGCGGGTGSRVAFGEESVAGGLACDADVELLNYENCFSI